VGAELSDHLVEVIFFLLSASLDFLVNFLTEFAGLFLESLLLLSFQTLFEALDNQRVVRVKFAEFLVDELLLLLSSSRDFLLKLFFGFLELLLFLDLQVILETFDDLGVVRIKLEKLLVQLLFLLLSRCLNFLVKLLTEIHNFFFEFLFLLGFESFSKAFGYVSIVGAKFVEFLVEAFLSLDAALDELSFELFILLGQSLLFPQFSVLHRWLDLRVVRLDFGEHVHHLLLLFQLTSFELHLKSFSSLLDSLELEVLGLTNSGVMSLDLGEVGVHLLVSNGFRLL